jgi:hypothetical protein
VTIKVFSLICIFEIKEEGERKCNVKIIDKCPIYADKELHRHI